MSDQLTMSEWARRQAPTLDVVSASVPEPVLLRHNLVAVFDEPDDARELVLEWERIEPADGAVGMVVLGRAPDDPAEQDRTSGADPEGVAQHAAIRMVQGAVPGAIVGALIVALIVLLLDGWSGVVIGAAIGGAAFGAVAGGVMRFVSGTGWGAAYGHSFVDADATAVVFASIHSDTADRVSEARRAAADRSDVRLYRVRADGRTEPEST